MDNEYYYLSHHGIVGMKWGKRNGPPYPLSDVTHDKVVKRAGKVSSRAGNKLKDVTDSTQKTSKNLRTTLQDTDKAINSRNRKKIKDYKEEYSKMSDEELRKIVNRDRLEQQYNEIRNRQETEKGKKILNSDVLNTAVLITDIMAVSASAVYLIDRIIS